jgi:hypothetical protein
VFSLQDAVVGILCLFRGDSDAKGEKKRGDQAGESKMVRVLVEVRAQRLDFSAGEAMDEACD